MRRGLNLGQTWTRGEGSGGSKLTTADVLEIKKLRAAGETCTAIGARFGVKHSTISRVCSGVRWPHLKEVN
jgi:hypothetical protein